MNVDSALKNCGNYHLKAFFKRMEIIEKKKNSD